MRPYLIAALCLALAAAPTISAKAEDRPTFGGYTCNQMKVPCENGEYVSASQWAEYGNACITRGFAYTNPEGFIDDTVGLNGQGCLTTKPNSIPKGMGAQLTTQCCLFKLDDSTCALHCDLVQQ